MLLLASHVVLLLEGGGVGFVDFIRVCEGALKVFIVVL